MPVSAETAGGRPLLHLTVAVPPVSRGRQRPFRSAKGTHPSATGDRWFESISLQRRVGCELPGDGNQVDREAFVDQKPHDTALVSRPRRVR